MQTRKTSDLHHQRLQKKMNRDTQISCITWNCVAYTRHITSHNNTYRKVWHGVTRRDIVIFIPTFRYGMGMGMGMSMSMDMDMSSISMSIVCALTCRIWLWLARIVVMSGDVRAHSISPSPSNDEISLWWSARERRSDRVDTSQQLYHHMEHERTWQNMGNPANHHYTTQRDGEKPIKPWFMLTNRWSKCTHQQRSGCANIHGWHQHLLTFCTFLIRLNATSKLRRCIQAWRACPICVIFSTHNAYIKINTWIKCMWRRITWHQPTFARYVASHDS